MSDPFADYSDSNYYDTQMTTIKCSVPVLSLLSTLFGWIGGLIIFLLEKQNIYVRSVALQSLIINGALFLICIFFLIFYWAHTFFVVMFWIMFVVHILILAVLAIIGVVKAKAGHFLGVPYLDKFILKYSSK